MASHEIAGSRHFIDVHSATWKAVEAFCEERLGILRATLETPGLGPLETDQIRGAIREYRMLLSIVAEESPRARALAGGERLDP